VRHRRRRPGGLSGAAVIEPQRSPRAGVVDVDEAFAQPDPIQADSLGQDGLQVGPMDADVGGPEASPVRGSDLVPADDAAAPPIPIDQRRYFEPARRKLRGQPELLEEPGRVGRQRDGGANLPQLGRLLVDVDADSVSA
jgi:hypothetical protein